ncbi:ABC transporter substrate-binding protein [Variovorax atrisoli]|uniref:ABC transporter substrate-binding protein n=1 Tax=Variovorax atrisoli TaxID=3394203 RepID=UPI00160787F4|nr:ABC transporter substrate-binding protein [Variovorax sp. BK613]MBB3640084.1 ABC-type branched-subunit amino acid transport system substrate-binding protein [Variovorax sp. BK613]
MHRRHFIAASASAAAVAGFGPLSSALAAENGVTDTEIVLGHTGILSGPLGVPIKVVMAGAGLAFDAVNAQGGLAGRKIRLVSLDDELKPEKAVANYEQLLGEHRAFAFFGCVGSGTTAAAAKLLSQSGAPLVGAYAVSDSAREKVGGSGYFVRATFAREAQALVQHLTTIGVTRIAVAYLDNPGGAEVAQLVGEALTALKLKPEAAVAVKGDGSANEAAGKALADSKAQAVIMYLGGAIGGEVMKAAWAAGGRQMFYGMSIVPGDVTARLVGDKTSGLAISQIVPYPWSEVDAGAKEYRQLAERAKVDIGYLSYEGYVNAMVMIEALRRTGRDLTRAKLHATLKAMKLRVSNMEIDFTGASNTGSRFIEMVRVTKEGRFLR